MGVKKREAREKGRQDAIFAIRWKSMRVSL